MAIRVLDDTNYFNRSFRMETILKHKWISNATSKDRPVAVEARTAWDKSDQEALTCKRLLVGEIKSSISAAFILRWPHRMRSTKFTNGICQAISFDYYEKSLDVQSHLDEMVEKFRRLTAKGELNPEFLASAVVRCPVAMRASFNLEFNIVALKNS